MEQERTFEQLICGDLPMWPYWAALFAFYWIGSSVYQYEIKIKRGRKKNGERFDPWKYIKDWQNHTDFAFMLLAAFGILRFVGFLFGKELSIEYIEFLCFLALCLGLAGQWGIDFLFRKAEAFLGINGKSKTTIGDETNGS